MCQRDIRGCCLNEYTFDTSVVIYICLNGAYEGTVRRFLEHHGSNFERIIFVVNGIDVSIYEILLPLYFPRTVDEENCGCFLLPTDLGDKYGEPNIPDRQIRIIDNPQHKYEGKGIL
ncbi:Ganglioside-induced differentiation-associated protein 2 [Halocaridina rubra]|uniref:Ganglioside-induced differentiation-associated protein 2 n=1 Tax=Halocaridina rubra TaxID=373956 RepID=A0AAN9ADB4_HALRR